MGLVILPLAFVDVSISVDKLALAVGLVIVPFANVLGSVRPLLNSFAFAKLARRIPVAGVNCAVW